MHLLTLSVSLLPLLSTAQLPPQATFPQRPSTILSIQRTMSYYPLIIDNKSFSDLSLVFTANAIANYSQPLNILTPLSVIESILAASLAPVTTQHLLSTQVIDVLSHNEAFSVTYFQANHFGVGVYEGQVAVAYGQYRDHWVFVEEGWRVANRTLVYMGPITGNLSIFT